ncbi:S49 family peptidase [Candidatus Woesearchaeota archaeon]|nr:S49 family peptidase [Candidatus Woesearchaeota archaeon]
MKSKKSSFTIALLVIVAIIAVLELIVIISSYVYIKHNYPKIFVKLPPAIMVIDIRGTIINTQFAGMLEFRGKNKEVVTPAENIVRYLEYYENDDGVKAFILDIDSNGGSNAGAEEIIDKIKHMKKPVVAVVRDSALSAGYLVAIGTERVFAQPSSGVGDIGAFVEINRTRNGTVQTCKMASTPFKEASYNDCSGFDPELIKIYRRILMIEHDAFVKDVAERRGLNQYYIDGLADGRIYYGIEALDLGLIDQIGGMPEAVEYLENKTNSSLEVLYLRDIINFNTNGKINTNSST